MGIKWEHPDPPVGRDAVTKLEQAWGVRLPEDYVTCALVNHGGRPEPNTVEIPDWGETCVQSLLSLAPPPDPRYPTVQGVYGRIRDRLPERMFPFAKEPGGNYFCFDYRRTKGNDPKIVFWDHDDADEEDPDAAIHDVCDTFTDLLNRLYGLDDEG
jgi:hypothetical protein